MATKMTAVEITERINKAQEVVRKLNELILKREAKLKKLHKDLAKASDKLRAGRWTEKELLEMDIEREEDALQENRKKLPEKQAILEKWQKKLEEVNQTDKVIRKIPEQLYKLMEHIREDMIKERTEFRDTMKKDYEEMERKEFREKYKYADFYKVYYQTNEDIKKEAERDSKYYIIDLVQRVTKKVGEITRWELWDAGNELNGWVWGTRGKAEIETIIAGGYNIQCLHTRVLVK